jgi:hypothetical protein
VKAKATVAEQAFFKEKNHKNPPLRTSMGKIFGSVKRKEAKLLIMTFASSTTCSSFYF